MCTHMHIAKHMRRGRVRMLGRGGGRGRLTSDGVCLRQVGELKAGYGLLGGVSTNIPKEDAKWQSTHDWLVYSTRASVPSGNCEVATAPA